MVSDLSIALTRPLGQEVHVLFILVILCTTIFFAHSLISLCLLALNGSPITDPNHPRIPSMTGPEGFQPLRPIRVHLARDEELEAGLSDEEAANPDAEKLNALKQPPPAYGLWRCSVRVDPNLLHWQRVDAAEDAADNTAARSALPECEAEGQQPHEHEMPRPPSYVSDDGVAYVVSAVPRSVAPAPLSPQPVGEPGPIGLSMSDVHPAYRTAF